MAHAYTPGLKVTENYVLRKNRILPLQGDVIVEVGQEVLPDTVVARTELPGNVKPVNAANFLGVTPDDIESTLLKKIGEPIKKDEPYAMHRTFFGLFKTVLRAEEPCSIENVSKITGHILLRGLPIPVEVKAYIRSKVVEVFPREGVAVQAACTYIQGIFGIGGETYGPIKIVSENNTQILDEKHIKPEHKGAILVGGNLVTAAALRKAIAVGAKGIIAGGFNDRDLRDFLGYDIGVAITGTERIGITLLITEGFGQINMAERTFELLKKYENADASLNGATQIRAGVIRPEVVITHRLIDDKEDVKAKEVGSMVIGSLIRVIRQPYFGRIGHVSHLIPELQKLESESLARVLEVEFNDGTRVIVPRANVEMIET